MPTGPRAAYDHLRTTPTSPRLMRRLTVSAIVANAGIVVTGAAVRLSNSGLGCPTWPDCTDGRLLPLGVVAQAVLGGITVRQKLNPLTVAPHFLLSMVLVFVAVWLHSRAGEGDGPMRRLVRRELAAGVIALIGVVAAVEIVGTLVTATGPHAGDPGTKRLNWDPKVVTQFHADLVFLYVGLVIALLLGFLATGAPAAVRRRTVELIVVIVLQATVGYVQYFTHVPAVLVGVHMFGATLATVATARLYFASRTRGTRPAAGRVDEVEPARREQVPAGG